MSKISSLGIAIGDFDEDLDQDYYISNKDSNIFHVNNSNSTFTESAVSTGTVAVSVVSWGTFFFDYDNDTYLDLFVANGNIMFAAPPQANSLYRNQQNGTFFDITLAQGIQDTLRSRGAIYGDIDNDGDLDILVVNVELDTTTGQNISLYKNNTDGAKNWIKIKLVGTHSNADAYGAHIELSSNSRTWMREIDGGSSYLSHNSTIAHFGLGNYTDIDSINVTWPDGDQETFFNPAINQMITITEFDASSIIEFDNSEISLYPNPASQSITISNLTNQSLNVYKIYSLDGKLIQEGNLSEVTNQIIDIQNITSGIYTMELRSLNLIANKRISIVN